MKDWLSTIFSLTAFVISVATFYINEVRVEDDLRVSVISLPVTQTVDGPVLNFRIAFINAGNRPAIVVDAKERCFKGAPEQPSDSTGDVEAKYPLILAPNEVNVVDVVTQLGVSQLGGDEFYCSLEFLSVDSRGADHAFKSKPLFTVKPHGEDTWQVSVFGGRPRPVMRLFEPVDRG